MGCPLSHEQLTEFCCGAPTAAARTRAEDHLGQCGTCLAEFFALKRDLELGARDDEQPAPATRAAVHREASILLAAARRPPGAPALRRALVLAGTVAAALTAAVLLGEYTRLKAPEAPPARQAQSGREDRRTPAFDSGRQAPGNLNVL